MYEAFYGFREKPFSMLPDPGFLYLGKKHRAALTLLEYGLLNHVGFCVISGEPGAGKTTILRALLERVSDEITVGLITNTHQSFGGLLDWILSAFNLHRPGLTQVEMHQVFMEFLINEYANGRTVLLIVDEAQNIKPDALEELRMLTNVNTEKDQLMQVVLAGQPALKDTLRLPDLMQFAQRIAVDYHLDPLSLEETCGYIQHRLLTAGAEKDVFTPAACERIFNYSGGTPRLINLLCETVLVYGYADQQDMIDVGLVDEMVLERMKDSVVPIVNRDIANQDNTLASKMLEENFPWIRPPGDTAELKSEAGADEFLTDLSASKAEDKVIGGQVKPDLAAVAEDEKAEITVNNNAADKKNTMPPGNQDVAENKANQVTVKSAGSTTATGRAAQGGQSSVSPAPSKKKPYSGEPETGDNESRKKLIKYGVVAVLIAVVLIVFALALKRYEQIEQTSAVNAAAAAEEEIRQRELEEKKLRQLQIEAETLKKERDAAIAKAEAEKLAKLEAEKQAAAEAAIAAKEAAKKIRQEEKKRVEAAKKREREAKKAEARAREAAKRAELEAEKLEEQRRVMQMRLDEEKRLKELEEARRVELERQRQELLAAEESAKQAAAEEAALKAAEKSRPKSAECAGPAARFKSACR